MLRRAQDTNPSLRPHQRGDVPPRPADMEAAETHPRRLSAFSRQASWDRVSLPMASHTLIFRLAMCQAFGVRSSQECVLSVQPCPTQDYSPCGQASSIPAPEKSSVSTGLYLSPQLQAAPMAIILNMIFLPSLPQFRGPTGHCALDKFLWLVSVKSVQPKCIMVCRE